jgi:dipeptidyl aminopeptidase/acylaminoacyl peptidase
MLRLALARRILKEADRMLNVFPGEPDWAIQTERVIAQVCYGGADIFECDRTSKKIKLGDMESWHREWHALGQELEKLGRADIAAGAVTSGKQRLFRASNYYRHADFFLPGTDPRKKKDFMQLSACFKEAIKHHSQKIELVQVKHGNDVYDGYFCHPIKPHGVKKIPTILMLGGADSLAEEIYFWGSTELAERGYAVLIIDTPGRGSSLRLKNIYTRPDYEVPVRAVIDYLVSRPDVDPDRIGCVGISMAGYYAPRAAAFEPRIKAMVLWCACYDILEDIYDWYPPIRGQIQWILGASNDAEAREKLTKFNLKGIAQNIKCPTLISHGAGDVVMRVDGARRLYEEISNKDKALKLWDGAEGGKVHCNYDNWSVSVPFMFNWLAARL